MAFDPDKHAKRSLRENLLDSDDTKPDRMHEQSEHVIGMLVMTGYALIKIVLAIIIGFGSIVISYIKKKLNTK